MTRQYIKGLLHCDVCDKEEGGRHRYVADIKITLCISCAEKWDAFTRKLGLAFVFNSPEERLKTFHVWREKQKNAKEKVILT